MRLLINESKTVELDGMKEVKIRIPVRSYVRLRSLKVLTGKQISDAVNEALEDYFAHQRPEPAAETAPPGSH